MKKVMTLLTGILISTISFAQISIGIQAGGTLSSARINNENDFEYTKKARLLPAAGVVVQYSLNEKFAVRSGLSFQKNGVRLNASIEDDGQAPTDRKVEMQNNLNYLQLPVNFLYTMPVGKIQLVAGAGGYINYGIGGKSVSKLIYTGDNGKEVKEEEKFDSFKSESDGGAGFKKTDIGISVLAGARFSNGVFANLTYQLGLTNIVKEDDGMYKNRGLQLSIGYFFWNK